MRPSLWQALLEPRTIALVGASGEAGKNTARPQQFLRRHGWTGTILPVNRSRAELFGETAYPDLDAVPGDIDHAFVMVPGAQVAEVIEACGRRKVPVVTVYSDGFSEAGEAGALAQQALASRARELGIRLLGPNCIGLINVVNRMTLTVNAALTGELAPAGRIAIVSQSGSTLGTLLSRGQARGMRFSRLVSVGNEADLGVGELTQLLIDDPHTDIVLLFLETLRDAPRLAAAARAAHAAGKAIVAYKLGRSTQGAALAVSHTGAIAGEDAAYDAFFAAHGILRVDMIETLLEIAPLLAHARAAAPERRTRSPRVAVVSTTGGGAAMVVDRLGLRGIEAATPTDAFIDAMAAQDISLKAAPVIDLTLAATPRKYAAVLQGLMEADFCDAVLAVAGSSAQFQPALAVEPIVKVATARAWSKPLAAFLAPHADASLALLADHGIAAFRTPEACADALAARLTWRAPRGLPGALPDPIRRTLDQQVRALTADTRLSAEPLPATPRLATNPLSASRTEGFRPAAPQRAAAPRVLDEADSLALFDTLGIQTVARALLREAPWTHPLAGPVAVKLVSADLPHKTEAGAVRLGIEGEAALAEAIDAMRASALAYRAEARIDGVMVQAMVSGMAEVLLGYRDDALLGPLVTLGVGGRLAEVYCDAATRVAPVDLAAAHEMIGSVRGLASIRGWRGQAPGDLAGLAAAIVALSHLACLDQQPVSEAEINPLIVSHHGITAVDGLVVLKPVGSVQITRSTDTA